MRKQRSEPIRNRGQFADTQRVSVIATCEQAMGDASCPALSKRAYGRRRRAPVSVEVLPQLRIYRSMEVPTASALPFGALRLLQRLRWLRIERVAERLTAPAAAAATSARHRLRSYPLGRALDRKGSVPSS
jgi:hypothetical protein